MICCVFRWVFRSTGCTGLDLRWVALDCFLWGVLAWVWCLETVLGVYGSVFALWGSGFCFWMVYDWVYFALVGLGLL